MWSKTRAWFACVLLFRTFFGEIIQKLLMPSWYTSFLFVWMGIALILIPIQLKIRAPYGRHRRKGWGPEISNKWGWFWMELPALLIFPSIVLCSTESIGSQGTLLVALWLLHYSHRTLVFPFRLRTKNKKMPLSIALGAVFFNSVNGFLIGYFVGYIHPGAAIEISGMVVLGLALFLLGMCVNIWSDYTLIGMRNRHVEYSFSTKGLFRWISCPNHFGEILEWAGFA